MVLNLYCIIYKVYKLDNIGIILHIIIPENATKLITKTWKEENHARMKLGINFVQICLLEYASIIYGGEQD